MLTAQDIKEKAKSLGAVLCGIGDLRHFEGDDPQRNPYSILPNGKSIIGCAFPVPKGLYKAMADKTQFYTYTSLGVKYIDETSFFYCKNLKAFEVDGENFTSAGQASVQVKKNLRQLGINADVIRRVSVAMYEGEINMVIHAGGGVAEVLVEACEVQEGDALLFMGEKTGVVEQKAEGIMLNEQPTTNAKQGDYISLKTVDEVRRGDKVYKEVER